MIREATLADVPALVTMGLTFLRESAYKELIAENADQMTATSTRLINEDHGVVLVAEHDGVLTGMIGLVLAPHHMSGELVAMECFWWSGSGLDGVRLLRAGERWALDQGAIAMQMVAPSVRIGEFYAKLGYGLIEWGYMRRFTAVGVDDQFHETGGADEQASL